MGMEALLGAFLPFGNPVSIGSGSLAEAGMIEDSTAQPVPGASAPTSQAIFLVVGNTPILETATEILVLRIHLTGISPDAPGGIESLLAVHLREAEVYVGSMADGDFQTVAIEPLPSSFDEWILANLPDSPAADRLPDADPDGDGDTNASEYAGASHPGRADSRPRFALITDPAQSYVTFYRRLNEPALTYRVEGNRSLSTAWQVLAGAPQADVPMQAIPPPGYEHVRQLLPQAGRYFARLRVDFAP